MKLSAVWGSPVMDRAQVLIQVDVDASTFTHRATANHCNWLCERAHVCDSFMDPCRCSSALARCSKADTHSTIVVLTFGSDLSFFRTSNINDLMCDLDWSVVAEGEARRVSEDQDAGFHGKSKYVRKTTIPRQGMVKQEPNAIEWQEPGETMTI